MDDLKKRLQGHAMKLGYFSDVPTAPLNHATCSIWKQFIHNVKTKNEIAAVRKNIIVNRFTSRARPPDQAYNELQNVKNKMEKVKIKISDNYQAALLQETNKLQSLSNSIIKEEIEEKRAKIRFLQLKNQTIKDGTNQLEDMVNEKGLPPISDSVKFSEETITKRIQTMVEQIEPFVTTQLQGRIQKHHSNSIFLSNTRKPAKTCFSAIKQPKPECCSLKRYASCTNIQSSRVLFEDQMMKHNYKLHDETNDLEPLDQSDDILPQSCFNFSRDDNFLTSFSSTYEIEKDNDPFKRASLIENSSYFRNQSNSLFPEKRNQNNQDVIDKILSNYSFMQNVAEVSQSSDKVAIWSAICNLREITLKQIHWNVERAKKEISFRSKEIVQEDRSKLHFIFTKNTILALNSKIRFDQLKDKFRRAKSGVELKLGEIYVEDLLSALDFQLENIKLAAAIDFLRSERNSHTIFNSKLILHNKLEEIEKAKQDLSMKMKEIEEYMDTKESLVNKLKSCQEDTSTMVKKLAKFICDPFWTNPLIENISLDELMVAKDVPLCFNKQISLIYGNIELSSIGMRSLNLQGVPNETLPMISYLMGNPHKCFECVANDVLRSQNKWQMLSFLEYSTLPVSQDHYTFKELNDQEEYVEKAYEVLISYTRSTKTHHILNLPNRMKMNMQLWLDMPFKRHISQDRTLDGKIYKTFEDNLNYIKNQIMK